jgi:hypothetical protein
MEDFGLLVVKNNLPIQFVESVWVKKLCMHLCHECSFHPKKNFSIDVWLNSVKKTKQKYVLPLLDDFTTITINFV